MPLTRDLLLWADRVFVMNEREDQHRTLIRIRFPDVDRPLVDLDIEDRWPRGDPELVALILRRLRPHLGAAARGPGRRIMATGRPRRASPNW